LHGISRTFDYFYWLHTGSNIGKIFDLRNRFLLRWEVGGFEGGNSPLETATENVVKNGILMIRIKTIFLII